MKLAIDYRAVVYGTEQHSQQSVMECLNQIVEEEDWTSLTDLVTNWHKLCVEPLSILDWETLLVKTENQQVFQNLHNAFRSTGLKPTMEINYSCMRRLIRLKQFESLTEYFNSIPNPSPNAYNFYLIGLVQSEDMHLIQRAKDIAVEQMRINVNPSALILGALYNKLFELVNLSECHDLLFVMAGQPGEVKTAFFAHALTNVSSKAQFEELYTWYRRNIIRPGHHVDFSKIFKSSWMEDAEFSLPDLLALIPLNSFKMDFFASAVTRFKNSDLHLLQLLCYPWTDPQRRVLNQSLYNSYGMGIGRPLPNEILEIFIDRALKGDQEAVRMGAHLAKLSLEKHSFLHFELLSKLLKRLMFYGHNQLAFEVLEATLYISQDVGISGIVNSFIKSLFDHGNYDLCWKLKSALLKSPVLNVKVSLDFFQNLLESHRAKTESPAKFSLLDSEQLISSVNSLIKAGDFAGAKELLEENVVPEEAQQNMLTTKLAVYSRMKGCHEEHKQCLRELVQGADADVAEVCRYGLSLMEGKSAQPLGKLVSTRAVQVAANCILQHAIHSQSCNSALRVMSDMFGPIQPDLNTYKHLLSMLIHNVSDERASMFSVEGIFDQLAKHQIEADLVLYNQLLEYASARERYSEVQAVMTELLERGGKPDQKLFNKLFVWLWRKGNLEACLDMFRMMERCGVPPTTVAFNTVINKYLELEDLQSAKKWILDSTMNVGHRCYSLFARNYYDRFYRSHPVDDCKAQLNELASLGFSMDAEHYVGFFEGALEANDPLEARFYLTKLIPLIPRKYIPTAGKLIKLCNQLLRKGYVDYAHRVYNLLGKAKDKPQQLVAFPVYLEKFLPELLAEKPEALKELVPPELTEPSLSARLVLNLAIREGLRLSERWCQAVLTNSLARGKFIDAQDLFMHMTTVRSRCDPEMGEKVCEYWRAKPNG